MMRQISVAFLPKLIGSVDLSQYTVVVTDVLRASTTMVAALHAGALDVIPVAEIPAAIELRDSLRRDAPLADPTSCAGVVLGGERRGVIIPGFDQGNSPLEFTPQVVAGKRLILCTTNGTVAVEECRGAHRILIGAFVNLNAVVNQLERDRSILIVCAGTAGQITAEDALFAGAVVERLVVRPPGEAWQLNDQARMAADLWQACRERQETGVPLAAQLGETHGGQNLLGLGYRADIDFCAQIDALPLVPELDQEKWSIRLQSVTQSR